MLEQIRHHGKGFTLIEVVVVIAIIGILTAIAIPKYSQYRKRSYDAAANSDAKNAYIAAVAYFTDYPGATINDSKIAASPYGFRSSDYVSVALTGTMSGLTVTTAHNFGTKTFTVNAFGKITQN